MNPEPDAPGWDPISASHPTAPLPSAEASARPVRSYLRQGPVTANVVPGV